MSLKRFIKDENQMASFFRKGAPAYPEDPDLLLPRHKQELADRLAGALSPENLTCDGELRGAKLQARTKLLHGAKADLVAMGVVHEWW